MANKRLNAVITIGGAVAGSLRGAFGTVTSETAKVGAAIGRLTERQRQLNAELAKIGRDGGNAASLRVQYANQELATIGKQIALLRQRDALEKARAANQAQRSELRGKIGSTVATGAMAALPIGAAIGKAANFQYELQLIGNTADMSAAEIATMGRTILQVSKDTQQSATRIREGMGFLIAAGMKPDQATQFLAAIGRTATATNANVGDLSKMVFTLSDSLKVAPSGMQDAIDTLAQAGKEGNVELRDMAGLLPVLGSGFVAMKMQGREAAATIGAALQIARKGAASADQAGTNFENFLQKVMSPETRKKAAKMGLDIEGVIRKAQAAGQNPFEAAVQAISKVTKGGDHKLIGDLFQDAQAQNFLRPMLQNWKEYQRIKESALSAKGVTDRDFDKIAATDKQKLNELANSMERLGIALGGVFAGSGQTGNSLAETIGKVTEFVNTNREVVGTTLKVVGALFVGRLAVLGVAYAFNVANGAWLAGRAAWMAAPAIMTSVGAALRFVGTSLLWVGRALLLNPIGLAVTAIAAIAASAFLIYKYWEPIKGFFVGVWDSVKSTFTSVYDWIVGKIAWLIEAPGKVAAKVREFIGKGANEDSSGGYDAMGNPTGGAIPELPAMAARGGTSVHDNSTNSYTIVQQPGQDARALAEELERRRRQQAGVRARSSLVDGVGAQ
jgi:TP901 family phage tail tape measure protein